MTDEPRENPTEDAGAGEAAQEQQTETPRPSFNDFVEHQRKAFEATKKALNALIPPDFKTYSEEACKEFFASFKALIESAGAAIEAEMKKAQSDKSGGDKGGSGPSTTGKTKVKIEVN